MRPSRLALLVLLAAVLLILATLVAISLTDVESGESAGEVAGISVASTRTSITLDGLICASTYRLRVQRKQPDGSWGSTSTFLPQTDACLPPPTTTTPTTTTTTTTTPSPGCTRIHTTGSVASFVNGLTAGQVGCLQGSFAQSVTITRGSVTLQSAPGTTATICGAVIVEDSADNLQLRNLRIDGSCAGGVQTIRLRAEDVILAGNEITNQHQGDQCILISQSGTGNIADRPKILGNTIHDCGRPSSGNQDHAIYVASGTGTEIADNVIYTIQAYSIQLYPGPNGAHVHHNVIDGGPGTTRGGIVLGGGSSVSNHTIEDNIVSYTAGSGYSVVEGQGSGNVVRNNCFWQTGGFPSGSGNVNADPLFTNRAAHDYSLRSGSPCAGKGPR